MFIESKPRFVPPRLEDEADNDHRSDASDERLLPSSPDTSGFRFRLSRPNSKHSWQTINYLALLTVLNLVLVAISLLFFFSPFSKSICQSRLSDQDIWKASSAYSPIFSRFQIPKIRTVTQGSLYQNPPSILRIPTGKEADSEWFRIGTGVFPIIITSDEVRALGKDPTTAVRVPEEYGYGPDAYIAQTDVYHHIHCLDMIRKQSSYGHYYEPQFGPFPGNDSQHIAHIGHCFDILAQSLKCRGSTDMITFNWVEGWDQPFPDFANRHVCRDFESMLKWDNENSLPVSIFQAMKKPPPGYERLPDPKYAGN